MNEELLLKFCDTDDERRKLPFSLGNYTYATNGIILIKVPRIAEYPENPKAPDPEKIDYEKNPEKWYPLRNVRMTRGVNCYFCGGEGEDFTCPECDGDGVVCLSNKYNEYYVDCKSCDGSGIIELCEECNGTGEGPSQKKPMDFHGVTFDQQYLALLSELPNCEVGLISKTAITPFRFDGGTGIIMPMHYPHELV